MAEPQSPPDSGKAPAGLPSGASLERDPDRVRAVDPVAAAPADESAGPGSAKSSPGAAPATGRRSQWPVWLSAGAAGLAVLALVWTGLSSQKVRDLSSGVATRLDGADRRVGEADSSLKRTEAQLRDLQQRQSAIDTRIAEAQTLYTQVEKLYRGLIQESADALLAETESTLMLASQQLALGVDPRGALIALEQVDQRLARQNDATLAPLRRSLAADIERLRAYPASEAATIATRIDVMLAQLDQWPLTAGLPRRERDPASASPASGSSRPPSAVAPQPPRPEGSSFPWVRGLVDDLQGLIRVRRVDHPESLLIAPDQAYFLRENLRLMLLNARIALLSRNEVLFRSDLERVIDGLGRYFDTDNRSVAQALMQLRQLRASRLVVDAPLPSESLAAVRAARTSRAARD
ncbi:MAG: hypothetical protein RL322_726 [Pseudomonadota bacterium]